MKKFVALLALITVVGVGAFAQITFGMSGALHMDEKLSASQIQDRFSKGEGIFYGPFAEVVFGKLGIGLGANLSFYEGEGVLPLYSINVTGVPMLDYDVNLYLSYHVFGGRAFLDPFGELGLGIIGTTFGEEVNQDQIPWDGPLFGSGYWSGSLGLGLNLGIVGVFGKFSFNHMLDKPLEYDLKSGTGKVGIPGYGYDPVLFPNGYLPKYRFTVGAKILL